MLVQTSILLVTVRLSDFEIGGRLILNDTLAGATFTQDVIGQDPTLGVGDGVGIGTTVHQLLLRAQLYGE